MGSRLNKILVNKLNKLTSECLKKYLEFFEYRNLFFDINNPNILIIQDLYKGIELNTDGKKELIVCDEYTVGNSDSEYVTLVQLIYDLDVFLNIPGEINGNISVERFRWFAKNSLSKMIDNGWEMLISNTGILNDVLNLDSSLKIVDIDISPKSDKCLLINCGDENLVNEYYNKYKSKFRIERHRFLELLREWIIFEICTYFKHVFNQKGVFLYLVNWEWAQNNYLYPKKFFTSLEKEERAKYSIYNIANNEEEYSEFLNDLYEEDNSIDYVRNVMNIPLKNDYGVGCIHHSDHSSKYLNVSLSERRTTDQPNDTTKTIYLLGGCVFFGYAIDDSNTIASCLQRKINTEINNNSIKVSNYGTWGGDIDQTYNIFFELKYHPGDIIVVSYAGLLPIGDYDISKSLSKCNTEKNFYYDGVVHCNKKGYKKVADSLFDLLYDDFSNSKYSDESFRLKRDEKHIVPDKQYNDEVIKYLLSIKKDLPPLFVEEKVYGSAVMNCNPFTLGHRFLIESAAKQVDYLIIFVVEENKSQFKFEDRIELVRKGTDDLSNVFVVPSGNLMISAVTFPGYFMKDNPSHTNIDSSKDVEIFGRYIAPALGIKKRFVGEEPTDVVTRRYNETMKNILPRFGIELTIVPRKKVGNGDCDNVISASTVRKLLAEGRYDEIKRYVPQTTYQYLVEHF